MIKYVIQEGKLVDNLNYKDIGNHVDSINPLEEYIFIYDVKIDEYREITLAESRTLDIDSSIKSPDGFEVGNKNGNRNNIIGGSKYLKSKFTSKKVDLGFEENEYNYFIFLGWVK